MVGGGARSRGAGALPTGAPQQAQSNGGGPGELASGCSVGIMAYNEEANIANAIESILEQPLVSARVSELIVVASGCTDRTAEIVAEIARRDPRVRLLEQEEREGKASAINLFIGAARSTVLVMVSADILVKEGSLDLLLRHFHNPRVGMVGGRPIPVNDETTFLGHAVHLLWRLHDRLARLSPKLGEIVAFRNVVPSIPHDTAVDEISIQALVTQLGYEVVYEQQAVVYNRGPATVRDFLQQRRRIYAGHLRIREQQGYAASTMRVRRILRALLGSGSCPTPRAACWTLCTVALEALARALGYYDYLRCRSHQVWKTATTTKSDLAEETEKPQNVLVFQILDFHRQQLELGVRATRRLAQKMGKRIQDALGPRAVVSVQQSGTIIALLAGDRGDLERRARKLVLSETHLSLNGHREDVSVHLACGIIAFPQAKPPLARSIPESMAEANLSTSIAS
jgi:poly-beta-1,6-N-acetyl-D-glucosamine synthase